MTSLDTCDGVHSAAFSDDDPYSDQNAADVEACCGHLDSMGYWGDASVDLARQRHRIDLTNPATAALVQRNSEFSAWLDLVPTMAALENLYDPTLEALPNGVPMTRDMQELFRNGLDPRGNRSRAAALIGVVIASNGGTGVETVRANVLRPLGMRADLLGASSLTDGYAVVEAVGLLEYLRDEDTPFTYHGVVTTRRYMAGAITFLRNAWACVRPGGVLVVGNMLLTHPGLAFTLNVIQWPPIVPRSIDAVRRIFTLAGIREELTVVLPEDGVYALYVAQKASQRTAL